MGKLTDKLVKLFALQIHKDFINSTSTNFDQIYFLIEKNKHKPHFYTDILQFYCYLINFHEENGDNVGIINSLQFSKHFKKKYAELLKQVQAMLFSNSAVLEAWKRLENTHVNANQHGNFIALEKLKEAYQRSYDLNKQEALRLFNSIGIHVSKKSALEQRKFADAVLEASKTINTQKIKTVIMAPLQQTFKNTLRTLNFVAANVIAQSARLLWSSISLPTTIPVTLVAAPYPAEAYPIAPKFQSTIPYLTPELIQTSGNCHEFITFCEPVTNLMRAIKESNIRQFVNLIQKIDFKQFNINWQFENHGGNTLLHQAILANNPAMVMGLLVRGADASIKNNAGESPRMLVPITASYDIDEYIKIASKERQSNPERYNVTSSFLPIHNFDATQTTLYRQTTNVQHHATTLPEQLDNKSTSQLPMILGGSGLALTVLGALSLGVYFYQRSKSSRNTTVKKIAVSDYSLLNVTEPVDNRLIPFNQQAMPLEPSLKHTSVDKDSSCRQGLGMYANLAVNSHASNSEQAMMIFRLNHVIKNIELLNAQLAKFPTSIRELPGFHRMFVAPLNEIQLNLREAMKNPANIGKKTLEKLMAVHDFKNGNVNSLKSIEYYLNQFEAGESKEKFRVHKKFFNEFRVSLQVQLNYLKFLTQHWSNLLSPNFHVISENVLAEKGPSIFLTGKTMILAKKYFCQLERLLAYISIEPRLDAAEIAGALKSLQSIFFDVTLENMTDKSFSEIPLEQKEQCKQCAANFATAIKPLTFIGEQIKNIDNKELRDNFNKINAEFIKLCQQSSNYFTNRMDCIDAEEKGKEKGRKETWALLQKINTPGANLGSVLSYKTSKYPAVPHASLSRSAFMSSNRDSFSSDSEDPENEKVSLQARR